MENICKICQSLVPRRCINDHIRSSHFLEYNQYVEFNKEKGLYLTPWLNIRIDRSWKLKKIMESINLWSNYLLSEDNFSKLWILNNHYRDMMVIYDFKYYDDLFSKIFKSRYQVYDDINLFSIKIKSAYPKILSEENIDGISILNPITSIKNNELYEVDNNKYSFKFQNSIYEISLSERVEYNNKTHYRYNILSNFNNPVSCKKLILSECDCVKFYSSNFDECKSILKVTKNGLRVHSLGLSEIELYYIKFYIMSNKHILKDVLVILKELIRNCNTVSDKSFLINTLQINPCGKFNLNIGWTCVDNMDRSKGTINISII